MLNVNKVFLTRTRSVRTDLIQRLNLNVFLLMCANGDKEGPVKNKCKITGSTDMKSSYFRSKMTNDYIVYYLSWGFPLWNDLHRWSLLNISHSIVFPHIGKTCLPLQHPLNTPNFRLHPDKYIKESRVSAEDTVSPSADWMWISLIFTERSRL